MCDNQFFSLSLGLNQKPGEYLNAFCQIAFQHFELLVAEGQTLQRDFAFLNLAAPLFVLTPFRFFGLLREKLK